jgi:hypothetical protein
MQFRGPFSKGRKASGDVLAAFGAAVRKRSGLKESGSGNRVAERERQLEIIQTGESHIEYDSLFMARETLGCWLMVNWRPKARWNPFKSEWHTFYFRDGRCWQVGRGATILG